MDPPGELIPQLEAMANARVLPKPCRSTHQGG
jgi:hypothetical protein